MAGREGAAVRRQTAEENSITGQSGWKRGWVDGPGVLGGKGDVKKGTTHLRK